MRDNLLTKKHCIDLLAAIENKEIIIVVLNDAKPSEIAFVSNMIPYKYIQDFDINKINNKKRKNSKALAFTKSYFEESEIIAAIEETPEIVLRTNIEIIKLSCILEESSVVVEYNLTDKLKNITNTENSIKAITDIVTEVLNNNTYLQQVIITPEVKEVLTEIDYLNQVTKFVIKEKIDTNNNKEIMMYVLQTFNCLNNFDMLLEYKIKEKDTLLIEDIKYMMQENNTEDEDNEEETTSDIEEDSLKTNYDLDGIPKIEYETRCINTEDEDNEEDDDDEEDDTEENVKE